jgi:DNA helicase-2/ATP-dependent DNA helicase PcrA
VRLEENHRSTPEVLGLANRLVPQLGGAEKVLAATRPSGPAPVVQGFASAAEEGAAIVGALRGLGGPLEQAAILCRTNARLTDFEEMLHDAGIPFQGASLLERDAARRLLRRLARSAGVPAAEAVRAAALEAGWLEHLPESLGERELVRQTDLARLVSLASSFDGDAAAFVEELRRRFDPGGDGARGVHLLTLHRAKGLEFEAVFLPRVEAKELPSRQARTSEQVAEERRLLYVGLTRAKRVLWVTWSGAPSPFLRELGAAAGPRPAKAKSEWTPLGERLRAWRLERARDDGVPPYVVFHDRVLHEIADTRPATLAELAGIAGVGPAKLERYGDEVLAALAAG